VAEQAAQSAISAFAIIIPHFNDVARLRRCLEAVMPMAASAKAVEVVVVDNNSSDDISAVMAAYRDARFVTEQQKGAAHARNRGVAETTAPGLIFLDSDCVPEAGWLARACSVARADAIIGGAVSVFDETPPPRSGAEAFETVFAFDIRHYIKEKGFTVTANLVTTRAVFERTGPFRPGLSEDLDWCRRAVGAGATLSYDPDLRVAHPTRQDWDALQRKWRRLTNEAFGLRCTGLAGRAMWALRALAMPLSILAHGPRIFRNKTLERVEKWRALAVLARLRLIRMAWMLRQAIAGRAV
jgi:GT2 family glycosyltransferase